MHTKDNSGITETIATKLGVRTVFVAGPFFKLVDPTTGVMQARDRTRFERLIHYFEGSGCTVHNAHRRESWGEAFLEPDDFTKLDYDEIAASDLIVAVPGPPASLGTHIELGWASAMGKPIVLLLEKDEDHALMVYGLRHITKTAIVEIINGEFEFSALKDAVIAVCGA
ncbi:nucleoside 2-deoxyribosyltransferase [Mycobacterium sp. 050134]|uniref:nucleoside 2-deoxyribosyltransferase n=1 Tax=Mycobacterium sp. 050134 TaxID=3096111 RepID=UPI002ED85E2D